ncbi:dihydroxy-acid dehydratase [Marivita sp. GX14005]|uniref:dihydroxy-acid dehydratase n=1 Tax=Marivita sp. GX14005 TaxID=2942276 RepID=UPI0020186B5C|nr:dihydroxy-acid dehydratase [Marivita sp. GX14005]MCL3881333.1 dihydroxy-acid dehydratase [Marivita sp. GX14005]
MSAALFLAALSACDMPGETGALSLLEDGGDKNALAAASLAGGAIVLSGPEGYCVDATSLRSTAAGGFAAIASCAILSGGQSGPLVEPALVTVTVARATRDAPSPEELARAMGAELLRTRKLKAVTAGHMASGGESAFLNSDPRHWRGTFVLNGRLIGLALYAPRNSPLIGNQGAAFLDSVAARIRANSGKATPIAQQSQPSTGDLAAQFDRLSEEGDL